MKAVGMVLFAVCLGGCVFVAGPQGGGSGGGGGLDGSTYAPHGCDAAPNGSCVVDSDCVIAVCQSSCQTVCGLPPSYARADIQGQECIVPESESVPASCIPPEGACGPAPGCPVVLGVARCIDAHCATVRPDQVDAGTSGGSDAGG